MGGGECREEPTDLPLLDLREWLLQHPPTSYFPDAENAPRSTEENAITVISVGLHVVGEVIERSVLGWVGLFMEIVEGLAHEAELEELPEKRREAQREAWHELMRETFWDDESRYPSSEAREKAFDALVGDNASHGVVPALSPEAQAQKAELISEINDRWLERTQAINERAQKLERLEADTPEHRAERERDKQYADHLREEAAKLRARAASPGAVWVQTDGITGGYWEPAVDPERALEKAAELEKAAQDTEHQQETWIQIAQSKLESEKAALIDDMRKDVQTVAAFDSDPSHWDLTPEQQAMLACDAPAPKPDETPHHSRRRPHPA